MTDANMPYRIITCAVAALLLMGVCAAQDAPILPSGLDGPGGPSLPYGPANAPAPPAETLPTEARTPEEILRDLGINGYWEVLGGVRTQHDPHEKQASAGETRLQILWEKRLAEVTLKVRTDLIYDQVYQHGTPRLVEGLGLVDLREANAAFSPLPFLDLRIGRQIITWGTGDLIFLNDLFPKDFRSFFIGRQGEYIRAPCDSLRAIFYTPLANLDLVYTPRFNPDRIVTGGRLSYYNPLAAAVVGRNMILRTDTPNEWFRDSEFAARVFRNVRGAEVSGYGYWGYWGTPQGVDQRKGLPNYPRLSVYGASILGPVGGGIGNVEASYLDSREDRSGDRPLVRNSEARFLIGYERDMPEIARDLTVGVQYFLQVGMYYDRFLRSRLQGQPKGEEYYHLTTLRITKLAMNQNLKLSLFAYYSPAESDAFLRPRISYKIDDHWEITFGGNVLFGARQDTLWGQFANNTNVFVRLRYSF